MTELETTDHKLLSEVIYEPQRLHRLQGRWITNGKQRNCQNNRILTSTLGPKLHRMLISVRKSNRTEINERLLVDEGVSQGLHHSFRSTIRVYMDSKMQEINGISEKTRTRVNPLVRWEQGKIQRQENQCTAVMTQPCTKGTANSDIIHLSQTT